MTTKAIFVICLLATMGLATNEPGQYSKEMIEGKLTSKEEKDCATTVHAYLVYSMHNGHHFDPEFVNLFNNYLISNCSAIDMFEEILVVVNSVTKKIEGVGCKKALTHLVEMTPSMKILERGDGISIQSWRELHPLSVLEGLSGGGKRRILSKVETEVKEGNLNKQRLERVVKKFMAVSKTCSEKHHQERRMHF